MTQLNGLMRNFGTAQNSAELVGQKLTVWTASGPVFGAVSRKAIHLLTEEERKQVPKLKDLWVDIGAKNKEEAAALVQVGDPVTLELKFVPMRNGYASSPGMDDKTGLWVAIEALRRTLPKKLNCALFAVSTVQEEIGLRGAATSAYTVNPHVGIAIDVTHATDCPTIDKKSEGDIGLGKGPVIYRGPNMNPRVVQKLLETATAGEIPYQMAASGRATGTDANTIQTSRGGVAAGLVSIPNRYMHSPVEMVSLDDLDRAAERRRDGQNPAVVLGGDLGRSVKLLQLIEQEVGVLGRDRRRRHRQRLPSGGHRYPGRRSSGTSAGHLDHQRQ